MAGRNVPYDTDRDIRGDFRAEIREFLGTRRARVTPEQVGLPVYGDRRRVTGLRGRRGGPPLGARSRVTTTPRTPRSHPPR
ncbi:hypothetical protein ACFWIZ_06425, partial [Streptomyces sp. NPDC127044]